jgi:hypothetical protein
MFDFKIMNPMSKVIDFFKEIFNKNSVELHEQNEMYMSSEEEYETWLGV